MAETVNIVIENDEWLNSIMAGGGETGKSQQIVPGIRKVPQELSRIHPNTECYGPMVVSVGPYHHGKQELCEGERIKVTMARKFVQDSGQPVEVLYSKAEEVANSARKYYAEGLTKGIGNEEFAHMMFLDGCFIIQFIYCFVRKFDDLRISHISAHLIKRDMFLLENQLPFQLLNTLMSLRFINGEAEGKELIKEFININDFRKLPPQSDSYMQKIMKFVRKYIVTSLAERRTEEKEIEDHQAVHLLELLQKKLTGRKAEFNKSSRTKERWRSYRSAKELRAVGISFRPSRPDDDLLRGVRFKSTLRGGKLELPPIVIDDSTKSLLLNLVAYETCANASNDLGVTSYICFIDSLIDHADDVKELRSKGILYNFLGSDQQVADLFNEISDNLVPTNAYSTVEGKIESHYKNVIKKWVAEWLHTHFSSPWTFLAFAAAVFAIILTSIQTYIALFPSEDNDEGKVFCSCTTNVTKMH